MTGGAAGADSIVSLITSTWTTMPKSAFFGRATELDRWPPSATGVAVAPEDVRDFQRGAAHRAGRNSPEAGWGRCSRSSGPGEALTVPVAMCR